MCFWNLVCTAAAYSGCAKVFTITASSFDKTSIYIYSAAFAKKCTADSGSAAVTHSCSLTVINSNSAAVTVFRSATVTGCKAASNSGSSIITTCGINNTAVYNNFFGINSGSADVSAGCIYCAIFNCHFAAFAAYRAPNSGSAATAFYC